MPDLNEQLRAVGVSRDAESPSGKGVLVSFNRAPTDDELRTLHDQLRQHGSAAQAVAGCEVNLVSSRMCERGTKSCTVVHTAPPVADAEGGEDVKDLAQARRLITQLRAALSRRPAAEQYDAVFGKSRAFEYANRVVNAQACTAVAAEQPAAAGNALADEQIDQFNRDLCDTPFIFRRKIDKSGYEVVQMMNADWREVIRDDQAVRWTGTDKEEGQAAWARLQTRWALAENQPIEQHLRAAPQAAQGEGLTDADENAPWLTLAHMICADAGIPVGHITDRLKALRDKLEATRGDALTQIRAALHAANNPQNGPITDTIWMPGRPETLFDFIDSAIAAHTRASDGSVTLMNAATGVIAAWDSSPVNNRDSLITERMYELRQARNAVLQQAASNSAEGAHGEAK